MVSLACGLDMFMVVSDGRIPTNISYQAYCMRPHWPTGHVVYTLVP